MIETVVRLITPIICGYLVFVVFSNKFLPWPKPAALSSRPRWLLGCCCGAAVAASLLLLMHFSYGKSLQELLVVAPPLGIIFLTLITGSVLAWLGYRKRCIDRAQSEEAYFDILESTYPGDQPAESDKAISTEGTGRYLGEMVDQAVYDDAFDAAYRNTLDTLGMQGAGATIVDNTVAQERPLGRAEQDFLQQAQQIAKQQYGLRCEVEKNLRITRKALLKLESEQHQAKAGKTENELLLESQLQEQIRNTAKAENRLLREVDRSGQLQSRLAVSKDLVLQAKAEVRTNMEARSNAILTARKSVNFAKRSLEARDLAERKLRNMKAQLDIQSQTTSKVIKALEQEKLKNREQSSLIEKLEAGQETTGLRKIQTGKTSKPWLSRVTQGKAGPTRIVRKVAEHRASSTIQETGNSKTNEKVVEGSKVAVSRKATEA